MDFNEEHLNALISDFKKESEKLKDIIKPVLEKNTLPQKEILEVCQVAKFSKNIKESVKLIRRGLPPGPDFIIEHKDTLKGLEHTRIFNPKATNILKIESLIEYTKNKFKETYPNLKILVYISIQEGFVFKQNQKKNIADNIIDSIHKKYYGKTYKTPSFLTQLRITSHSSLVFEFEENHLSLELLPKELLIKKVKNKERKIEEYKKGANKLKKHWLLLLLDITSSTSYAIDENTDYSIKTSFERVYLMEDLGSKIIRIG